MTVYSVVSDFFSLIVCNNYFVTLICPTPMIPANAVLIEKICRMSIWGGRFNMKKKIFSVFAALCLMFTAFDLPVDVSAAAAAIIMV